MSSGLFAYYAIGIAVTFVAAVLTFVLVRRYGWEVPRWLLIGMIVVVPPLLLATQLLKFASLHMYADVSHWLQLLYSVVTTGKPYVLTHEFIFPGTLNYLAAHFVPLIYLFALPFKLLPYPQTLIVLNVAVMSSAAIPLYFIAKHRTGDRRFALLCAALFLWYPTFQYTTLYEFEMLRYSIPILLWMLYAWERQWIGRYYALAVLATLVREEVGLTVGMFGVYLFLVERRRMYGATTALLGFGAFAVITQLLMPALRGPGTEAHFAQGLFSVFGATPLDVILGILQHPVRALAFAADPIKLANLSMLFVPFLFLSFFAPAALLPVLATFGIVLLSEGTVHTSYMLYYVTPAVPFLFWAFMRAWPRVCGWLARCMQVLHDVRGVSGAATVAVLCGVLVVNVFFGPSPLALQFWSERYRPAPFKTQSFHRSVYRVTDHHRSVRAVVAAIPRDAIVSTQEFLMPRLFEKRGSMVYPMRTGRNGQHHADYVLLDTTNNGLRGESPAFITDEEMGLVRGSAAWQLLSERDGYVLYRLRP